MFIPDANILQPLIDVANAVLKFFHDTVGLSWGLSIVAITVCTRAILIPLTYKQLKGMRAMQALQPQIKELQEKYKNDKQRMQQEMMRFYKENKVNPFASCIPLLAQLPVFITLFYVLQHDLRFDICGQTAETCSEFAVTQGHSAGFFGESFFFINDLTAKDRKSTRLNSSHVAISYAVFCLKKKKQKNTELFLLEKKIINKQSI